VELIPLGGVLSDFLIIFVLILKGRIMFAEDGLELSQPLLLLLAVRVARVLADLLVDVPFFIVFTEGVVLFGHLGQLQNHSN
jgi:hypothetical protein